MRKKIILLISFSVLFLIAANFFAPDIAIDWWAIGPSSQVMSAVGMCSDWYGWPGGGGAS